MTVLRDVLDLYPSSVDRMANVTELVCSKFGENVVANTSSRRIGTVVSVKCQDGYKMSEYGASVLTCQYTGQWSDGTPYCHSSSTKYQLLIIVICSVASAVALGVLLCALYMLLANCRKERIAKVQKREHIDTIRELSIYHAITQDCVGMPPVVYDNISATLRGRTSTTEDSKPSSPQILSGSETDLATEKAFIY